MLFEFLSIVAIIVCCACMFGSNAGGVCLALFAGDVLAEPAPDRQGRGQM